MSVCRLWCLVCTVCAMCGLWSVRASTVLCGVWCVKTRKPKMKSAGDAARHTHTLRGFTFSSVQNAHASRVSLCL